MPVVSACLMSHCVLQLPTLACAHRSHRGAVFCTTYDVDVVHPHVMQGSPQPGLSSRFHLPVLSPQTMLRKSPKSTASEFEGADRSCRPTLHLPPACQSSCCGLSFQSFVTSPWLCSPNHCLLNNDPEASHSDVSCCMCGREGMGKEEACGAPPRATISVLFLV